MLLGSSSGKAGAKNVICEKPMSSTQSASYPDRKFDNPVSEARSHGKLTSKLPADPKRSDYAKRWNDVFKGSAKPPKNLGDYDDE